jgi:hypothetical protein
LHGDWRYIESENEASTEIPNYQYVAPNFVVFGEIWYEEVEDLDRGDPWRHRVG